MALFYETIVKIMSNFIRNETRIFTTETLPDKNITKKINYKNAIYEKRIHHSNNHLKSSLFPRLT